MQSDIRQDPAQSAGPALFPPQLSIAALSPLGCS